MVVICLPHALGKQEHQKCYYIPNKYNLKTYCGKKNPAVRGWEITNSVLIQFWGWRRLNRKTRHSSFSFFNTLSDSDKKNMFKLFNHTNSSPASKAAVSITFHCCLTFVTQRMKDGAPSDKQSGCSWLVFFFTWMFSSSSALMSLWDQHAELRWQIGAMFCV